VALRLLHLSDIHFGPNEWQASDDQRNELLADIRADVSSFGVFDAILVGGDIAFSGAPAEYAVAREWLRRVQEAAGVGGPERVYVVPGNHDVELASLSRSAIVREFRSALDAAAPEAVDMELHQRLVLDPGAEAIMLPLAHYNEFAEQYLCGVSARKTRWVDDSTLMLDGHRVRITGLTSVLTSDKTDSDGPTPRLVLGSHQCILPREPGLIDIVLVHHPPAWVKDWGIVAPALNRAHVLLFGHEHTARASQITTADAVHIFAGAVSPERRSSGEESPFVPTYNTITLSTDVGATLHVLVRTRQWDIEHTRFESIDNSPSTFDMAITRTAEIDLPIGAIPDSDQERGANDASPLVVSMNNEQTASFAHGDASDLRKIAVTFMQRSASERLRIARELGVLSDTDFETPSAELYVELLHRIRERDLIGQLEGKLGL
jgi:hypothetical protein